MSILKHELNCCLWPTAAGAETQRGRRGSPGELGGDQGRGVCVSFFLRMPVQNPWLAWQNLTGKYQRITFHSNTRLFFFFSLSVIITHPVPLKTGSCSCQISHEEHNQQLSSSKDKLQNHDNEPVLKFRQSVNAPHLLLTLPLELCVHFHFCTCHNCLDH